MFDVALFSVGFALVLAGAVSLLYPLRWLGVRTRAIALVVIATGFLIVAIAAQLLDSYFVYLGLILAFLGLISLVRPLRFLSIRTRGIAALALALGTLLAIVSSLFPYSEKLAAAPTTKLDEWMPRWQVGERHAIEIKASPDEVFAAIHAVTADEILLFRTLIAIRRCGQDGPESILNVPERKSLLDVATETSFIYLENGPREIVVGTVISAPRDAARSQRLTAELFRRTLRPGVVLATMNFFITPRENGGSTLTTETRVYANSAAALRRFGVYWRMIRPGSDIIRRMWLRAIGRRAEKT
jgi:hypothetical protein